YKIIQTTLDEIGAFAPESLIKVITELTIDYEDIIVKNLVIDIAKESKEECIDQKICFRKLIQTMQKHDKNQKLTSKANQLAEVALDDFSLNLSNNEPSKSSFSNSIAYLLKVKEDTLRNLPHKKIEHFKDRMLRGAAYGAGGVLGAGTIVLCGLSIKKLCGNC
ncbi:MAG: hypothetical protein WCD44_04565, partial [Candidatus Babeliales bacterium]